VLSADTRHHRHSEVAPHPEVVRRLRTGEEKKFVLMGRKKEVRWDGRGDAADRGCGGFSQRTRRQGKVRQGKTRESGGVQARQAGWNKQGGCTHFIEVFIVVYAQSVPCVFQVCGSLDPLEGHGAGLVQTRSGGIYGAQP
jgi:hypothetical protein